MNNNFKKLIIGILFLGILVTHSLFADTLKDIKANNKIVFGVKHDFKPFGYINEQNETVGFDIDVAKYIAQKIGGKNMQYELRKVLSKDRIEVLQKRSVDIVIASMTITDERAKLIDFSVPYFFETQAMLVRKDELAKNYKGFGKRFIGAIQGATSGKNLLKLKPNSNVVYFQSYPQIVQGLKNHIIDAITTDYSWCYVQTLDNPNDFKVLKDVISDEPYGIGVSKGETALVHEINTIMQKMVKDGTYNKIYQKWFNKKPAKMPKFRKI